jgi:hypothetical protein
MEKETNIINRSNSGGNIIFNYQTLKKTKNLLREKTINVHASLLMNCVYLWSQISCSHCGSYAIMSLEHRGFILSLDTYTFGS